MTVREKEFSQKKPDQLVYIELGNANGGMLLSISEDGFRFRAVTPVRGNGNIPFAFSLDGKVRLEGSGAVEWTEDDGKSGGMRFTEVSPEFRTTLADWLSGKSSHNSSRREPSPAEADRRDTMEAIQQELRAGYPQHPAKKAPQLNVPEQKAAKHKFQEQKFPEQKPEPRLPYRISEPVTPERKPDSLLGARRSETTEPNTAHKLFPLQPPPPAESEKSASSVFLKRAAETKVPAETPAMSTPPPTQPRFFQPLPVTDPKKSLAMHAHAATQQRPYIPALEDSFQNAWDQARLSAPQDSPHLTRAAAGSIIAIALAVILGALIYNFRQDIGATFIQLGQSISGGDNHPAASAPPQQPKTDTAATEQQNTNQKPEQDLRQGTAPADSGSAENSGSAGNPDTNTSTTSPSTKDGNSAAGANANNPPANGKNRALAPASSQSSALAP